jgi:hypothetical protein
MSTRRVSVFGASFVCSVDSTRWPVCAALIAISAVSRSRTSPTMITSGSWRRNARSAEANVRPTFGFTLTWLMPGTLISAGSSAVEMFRRPVFRMFRPGVERDGLAAAGRAGHEDHPVRLAQVLEIDLLLVFLVTERVDAELRARRIEQAADDLLAVHRRAGVDAEVDRPVLRQPHLDAAVLRDPPLGDVEPRHDLEARGDLHRERTGGFAISVSTPSWRSRTR